jgi:hypothetical protein
LLPPGQVPEVILNPLNNPLLLLRPKRHLLHHLLHQ